MWRWVKPLWIAAALVGSGCMLSPQPEPPDLRADGGEDWLYDGGRSDDDGAWDCDPSSDMGCECPPPGNGCAYGEDGRIHCPGPARGGEELVRPHVGPDSPPDVAGGPDFELVESPDGGSIVADGD